MPGKDSESINEQFLGELVDVFKTEFKKEETHISPYFNQSSNKIIAAAEFYKKVVATETAERGESMDGGELICTIAIIQAAIDWEDEAGKKYISEMQVKTIFSNIFASGEDTKTLDKNDIKAKAAIDIPQLQSLMDSCEDHTEKLKAKKLKPL